MVSLSTAAVTIQPASTITDTRPRTTKELNWKSSVLSDTEDKFATFSGSHSSYLSSTVPTGFDTMQDHRLTHTAEEVMELWPGRSRSDSGPTKPTNYQPKSFMPIYHQFSHFCTCKTSPCHDMETIELQTNRFIILADQLHSVILT
jgi:hypothetical protein